MELSTWLFRLQCHQQDTGNHNISELVSLIHSPPPQLWSESEPLSETHIKAIKSWLDGCLLLFHYFNGLEHHQIAYQYIQLAYARLQSITANPHTQIELRYWGAAYLDQLTVMMLEFCQRQPEWQQESNQLIELHIAFMAPLGELNMRNRDQRRF
ncbi:hypothetical protein [Vibrio sp.]|uniref:hypothetical protein n=1 Tax=Vibrio sp. TaxID=678 RepID=UPI003AA88FA8